MARLSRQRTIASYIGAGIIPSQGSGFGPISAFDPARWGFTPTLNDPGGFLRATGDVGLTPEASFDKFSTARSAPGVIYYIDPATGSDGGGRPGTDPALPIQTVANAFNKANIAGVPFKLMLAAGDYSRNFGPGGVIPTVDCAIIGPAVGRANIGSYEAPAIYTFTQDATYPTLYSKTSGNYERVCDRGALNKFGNYTEYDVYATPELLVAATLTANSGRAYAGGKLYLRRADGAAPTYANTRLYISMQLWRFRNPINVYFENVDTEGAGSCYDYAGTSVPASLKTFTAKNCSGKYSGGLSALAGKGFSLDSVHGLTYLHGCSGDENGSDGINYHRALSGAAMEAITVNCNGRGNGRAGYASCQGITAHEDVKMMDVGGYYSEGHGITGNVGFTSSGIFAGTLFENDLGDKILAGGADPCAFGVFTEGTPYYLWNVKLSQPAGQGGIRVGANARVYHHNLRISAGATTTLEGPNSVFQAY